MTRFFYAQDIVRPEDVIPRLARGERHWRKGYSAYELASAWIGAGGIPPTVRAVLDTCPDYRAAELVEGLFEREVDLRTPGRRSQTDLLAFIHAAAGHAVVAVEGKVAEPFGPLVADWNDGSGGKARRLAALCGVLGLAADTVRPLRYQLLHRAVSAVFEAQRYHCPRALLLVHSFCPAWTSFRDFVAFTTAVGSPVDEAGTISAAMPRDGVALRFAWVADAVTP